MTLNIVETSPLRAAREWRGISLALAARSSALTLSQAEALEGGDASSFNSVESMVASAVLYGACLGIGRDEALALLDRTLDGRPSGAESDIPQTFSDAVRVRSEARAADRALAGNATTIIGATVIPVLDPDNANVAEPIATELPLTPVATTQPFPNIPAPTNTGNSGAVQAAIDGEGSVGSVVQEEKPEVGENDATGEIPVITPGMVLEHSDAVRSAMSIDPMYRTAVEQTDSAFLEWSEGHREPGTGVLGTITSALDRGTVTLLGEDRARKVRNRAVVASDQVADASALVRERLRQSEHSTLIVAVGIGIVVLALLLSIASVFGNGSAPTGVTTTGGPEILRPAPTGQGTTTGTTPAGTTGSAAATHSRLPVAQVMINVRNAGRIHGKAAQIAQKLRRIGYQIGFVGNGTSRYTTSVILYPAAYQAEAQRLGRQAGITTLDTLPGEATKPLQITIIVK